MKKMIKTSIVIVSAMVAFNAYSSDYDSYNGLTCSAKQEAITTQMEYAQKSNNQHQLQGLQKALDNVQTYCNNDDLEQKYQQKIQEKTEKVTERQQELEQAQLDGKTDKIAKKAKKLQEAQAELNEAQQQLAAFYQAIKTN